jgi:redox-sensitive bicupin YhaK (pirin superfamily)
MLGRYVAYLITAISLFILPLSHVALAQNIQTVAEDGSFSIVFPSAPEHTKVGSKAGDSNPSRADIYLAKSNTQIFLASNLTYDKPITDHNGELEANVRNFLKETGATLVSSKIESMRLASGANALAIHFSAENSGWTQQGMFVMINDQRLCGAVSGWKKGSNGAPVAQNFLRSLKINQ